MSGSGEDHRALSDLSGLLLSQETVQGLLDIIVGTAVSGLAHIDEASISLVAHDGDQLETVNASSAALRQIDEAQYEESAGPCVQAIRSGEETTADLPSLAWPVFPDAALGSGFRSVWSIPLQVREQTTGVVNLYSRSTAHAVESQAGSLVRPRWCWPTPPA